MEIKWTDLRSSQTDERRDEKGEGEGIENGPEPEKIYCYCLCLDVFRLNSLYL